MRSIEKCLRYRTHFQSFLDHTWFKRYQSPKFSYNFREDFFAFLSLENLRNFNYPVDDTGTETLILIIVRNLEKYMSKNFFSIFLPRPLTANQKKIQKNISKIFTFFRKIFFSFFHSNTKHVGTPWYCPIKYYQALDFR